MKLFNAGRILSRKKWLGRAAKFASNPRVIIAILTKARTLLTRQGFKESKDKFELMINYISDIFTGKYKTFDKTAVIIVIAALLYVVTPIDVIPDFIIGIGWIDDIAILGYAFDKLSSELDKYSLWKEKLSTTPCQQ